MLTEDQERWVMHLSDEDAIVIIPWDPTAQAKFEQVRETIRAALGADARVEHRGATSLGISGQDEIDVYVPVPPEAFDLTVARLREVFGEPGSHYPMRRAHFVTFVDGKHVDVFAINDQDDGLLLGLAFEARLRSDPALLEAYRLLKENGHGLSGREYYRRKFEFVNAVVADREPKTAP